MDTTLPLPFVPSVDLRTALQPTESEPKGSTGLAQEQLSYLGCVYLSATSEDIDAVLQFLGQHISIEVYVNATAVNSIADIITCLDAGARKVFVNISQADQLEPYQNRLIPVFSGQDDLPNALANGVLVEIGEDLSVSKPALEKLTASKISPVFATPAPNSGLESFIELTKSFSAIPIIPVESLTVEQESIGKISVPALIGGSWASDRPDKLVPTVVTDERGIALGLVYSSQESVSESLKTGTGVYQSRKRGLWYKGATSGDVQELVRISMDCDQDCLKYIVRQKGRGEENKSLVG